MSEPVRTVVERFRPWIFVEVVDTEIMAVQFNQVPADQHDDFVDQLRGTLSQALTENSDALLQNLPEPDGEPATGPQREVMEFVAEVLAEAAGASPLPQRQWFPDQADGRDASGAIHASLRGTEVVILEVEPGSLADPQPAGLAIRDAVNLASQRLAGDVRHRIARLLPTVDSSEAPELDWQALASVVKRIRGGYL